MTQAQALAVMKLGHNVFLTGEPGSGKTHTINQFIEHCNAKGISVGVTASTGIAATHIGGMTIHSWSGIGIKDSLEERQIDALARRPDIKSRFKRTRVLIIDEISMLDGVRLNIINQVCRALKNSDKPFGGLQVILCGDLFQLPPVNRYSQAVDFPHLSAAWEELNLKICYLKEQHRQEDDELLDLLRAIREARDHEYVAERLLAGHRDDDSTIATRLYSHNANVDELNNVELAKIDSESKVFTMTMVGAPAIAEGLAKTCLAPEKLELKVGAEVLCVANNVAQGYVNGTRGQVVEFRLGKPVVQLHNGKVVVMERTSWKLQEGDRVVAEVAQYPLRLAWAITIHKSQGMSLDEAEIDLSRAFTPGMGYVALSRLRSLSGLRLKGLNNIALMVSEDISEYDRLLQANSARVVKSLEQLLDASILEMQATVATNLSQDYAYYDKELFEKLKAWRSVHAKKQKIPGYRVLPDKSLIALSAELPTTLRKLSNVHGIGPKKQEQYGEELITLMNQHTGKLL